MPTLAELFADPPAAMAGRSVTGVTADSRKAGPGVIFVAIPGVKADGLAYATKAAEAGAVAVVAERQPPAPLPGDVPVLVVANARAELSRLAASLFPRQPATVVAVTGTSGKTSVTAFLRQIWLAEGKAAASLGTIGIITPTRETYGSLTTPDPVDLHRLLDEVAGEGVTHLAMEASSHGLEQHRLDGVRLSAAAFLNLSRDHLDYHPDMESYFAAKMRLFSLLPAGAPAVVDVDSDWGRKAADLAGAAGHPVLSVGAAGEALKLKSCVADGFAQNLVIAHGGQDYRVRLPLAGQFQVQNALVAAGLAIATGSAPAAVFAALESLKGAAGRLDYCGERHGAPVFVDYAHKPDALANALEALRPFAKRRLIVVFGCGGDRDAGKRPIMGAIAAEKADVVIVTDDNPRSEAPATIRAAILAAAPGALEIGDRLSAIRAGVAMLESGDVLLIAGKGHETGQIIGERTLDFSDHAAVAAALAGTAA